MVAYSFRSRFIAPIQAGTKRQTIRGERKRHVRPGETLQLYCAMRTKQCRAIGTARCSAFLDVYIWPNFNLVIVHKRFISNGIADLDAFAVRDGFKDWDEMKRFWLDLHPKVTEWSGHLIEWTDFRMAANE